MDSGFFRSMATKLGALVNSGYALATAEGKKTGADYNRQLR